ncbi:hypothetical protein HGRIS_009450 [Hohenbuehelia grisea]|uniref:non-specific serine/threonine protein kinase n=1 Tax=Hohenbuehelia grisea TaxID=104357 RepID=A0ABR3J1A5_9AGAR
MSDTGPILRRQPPSPLVFSTDPVASPMQPARSDSSARASASSNTVSMPFVRRHVTRRLKAAKAECDKEMQRVTQSIQTFFEERLRDGDHETQHEARCRERDRDSQAGDFDHLRDTFAGDLRSALQAEDSSSDGGYDGEVEYGRHGRHRANTDEDMIPPVLTQQWSSSPGITAASTPAAISPASLRRQHTAPWERPLSSSVSSSAVSSSPATSTVMLPEAPITRKQSSAAGSVPTSWGSQGVANRRLSRTIHIPSRPTRSSASSRSTSRSRSPLPPIATHASFSEYSNSAPSTTSNRRSSRILVDDPVDPIMTALYEIISVATDVSDMSVAQLTAQPKVCESLVQRVQNIGKVWDEHPDWHGRNWYVQVLLAVASLSRVVEWWEAEKQFWNFNDNDDEQDEPLMFVTKPADEPELGTDLLDEHAIIDDDNRARSPRSVSQRKSRDEQPKDLSVPGSSRDSDFHSRSPRKPIDNNESARVLATERLRLQAETAQNQNIVMELSLDGDYFIWINYAWRVVVGTDPEDLIGTRVSELVAPSEATVFLDATRQLQEDDSHTVEVRFNLKVEPNEGRESSGTLYQLMEGKGMLMIDREDGIPTHTMWVVRPIAPARYELEHPSDVIHEDASLKAENADANDQDDLLAGLPFSHPISTELILCRICEGQIPQWYFEKHCETCVEIHRLEAEIAECNESISELRNTIRDLTTAVDRSSPAAVPEYRGMPIFTPSSSPIVSSPLHLFRANKMRGVGVKKMQRRLLEQLEDILQVASEVSIPTLKEDEAKEPIERQRLLSPGSERKISTIRNWSKPATEDAALSQLVEDAERVMRQKIDNVVRMQNTIRYSEKIWREWEEKVDAVLEAMSDSESDSEDEGEGEDVEPRGFSAPSLSQSIMSSLDGCDSDGDHSSTTSEYAYSGDQLSTYPTPLASSSPVPLITPPETRPPSVLPTPVLPSYSARQALTTRSSTPSSVSSPLALAAPIIAPASPEDNGLPPMSLDEPPSVATLKPRRSAQNLLEPRVVVTPPASPQVIPKDGLMREPSTRRGHRRHSTAAGQILGGPLSPRQSSVAPLSRTNPTSIKDFDIIKPISKGAFGSVFLAKKKATGDYYAIKVLKKADMIAKNQITNVKAERMILMKQAESPFVAKLYFTFQSRDNLYLVMEYLNGGDCAALIKSLGSLPEEWTRNYIAEVVLGLEYLHQRGIVHRDLKPDNLLIDQHGHLKLTDFGLSRIGLLGRQTHESQTARPMTRYNSRSRPPSMDSAYLSSPLIYADSGSGDDFNNDVPEPFAGLLRRGGGGGGGGGKSSAGESPLQSFATELTTDLRSHSHSNSNSNSAGGTPPGEQKFVGTPDYLAPETILGLRGNDAAVDWWALGIITYEFLYGLPPFHAESPEKVFENILSGHVEWHEDWVEFSDEARDFMARLMTLDPSKRLGANGAEEVKQHPFLAGIDWDKVTTNEAAFIPQVTDPESTDYFDPRGAIPQLFHDDDQLVANQSGQESPVNDTTLPPLSLPIPTGREAAVSPTSDDFGSFSYKNVPVLKQANDDVIRKLKTDQMVPLTQTLSEPASLHARKRSVSHRFKKPPSVVTNSDSKVMSTNPNPPSPATSTSSIASSPSRSSLPPSTPAMGPSHARKHSEYGAIERFKQNYIDGGDRRNSMPSRLRTASVSSAGDNSGSENYSSIGYGSMAPELNTPPSSVHSIDLKKGPDPSDRAVVCLLAEDNPITAKIIETLLIRLGCRCVVVADGSEAISVAMGDIKFDVILMDLHMPVRKLL